ncbi:MAG: hypothetical protein V1887_02385 [Candidatus Aenigmatarchaeota archaeon]
MVLNKKIMQALGRNDLNAADAAFETYYKELVALKKDEETLMNVRRTYSALRPVHCHSNMPDCVY